MRETCHGVRKVQEQQLRNLHRQLEEILGQAEGEEELVLYMPPGHPLTSIPPIDERTKALEQDIKRANDKLELLERKLDKIGEITVALHKMMTLMLQLVDNARQEADSQRIIVPRS